jgi:hypothetical protein
MLVMVLFACEATKGLGTIAVAEAWDGRTIWQQEGASAREKGLRLALALTATAMDLG